MGSPVKYAEDTLGVHKILETALKARDEYSEILSELTDMRKDRRQREFDLEMYEMEIAADERVRHPEMSATAMKDHLKGAFFKNEKWRKMRQEILELINKIEEEDADRSLTAKDLEIANARMIELGGYLMFLGSAKLASVSSSATPAAAS